MSFDSIQPVRVTAAAVLLVAATAMSLVFFGTGANLVVLALVVAALLAALVCIGPRRYSQMLQKDRSPFLLACAILGYLVIAYRFGLSPDNNFAASWVLAAGPLAFIGGLIVVRHPSALRLLVASVVAVVVLLAVYSCIRFLIFGERAHQPMIDPNNYATLTYLIWIPLVHWHLSRGWCRAPLPRVQHGLYLAATFVLILAIVATRSRTSVFIVVGAFGVWAAICAARRVSLTWLVAHFGVALLAGGVALLATTANAPLKGLEFGGGVSIRTELIRAALTMFLQHPLGIGVFGFPLLYPSFRSLLEQETAGLFVHNDYIQFLVEGGVPLLLLLVLFAAAVLRRSFRLIRLAPQDPQFATVGAAMALTAVCTHALVNFVFYSLTLSIVIGLLAALLLLGPDKEPKAATAPMPAAPISVGIVGGWLMWLYLVLDVAIVGVFQDQPSFGFGTSVRADQQRMLEFSRVAQRINGNRGIPALGEALLLYRAARAEPNSAYLREQAYDQFRRAMTVDPWNMLAYVQFSQFLDEFPPARGRAAGESDEELLFSALGIDPVFVPAIDRLLQLYDANGQEAKSYHLLRSVVYPWMLTLRRSDPDASDRYFDQLERYADANADEHFRQELRERRRALAGITPTSQDYWFL